MLEGVVILILRSSLSHDYHFQLQRLRGVHRAKICHTVVMNVTNYNLSGNTQQTFVAGC